MIRARQLVKRFGRAEVLQGLDLHVPDGAAYALIGGNGAGKTTTIRILMNLIEADAGEPTVLGRPSRSLGPHELRQIGFVAESMRMPQGLTVREYFDYLNPFYGGAWDRQLEATLSRRMRLPEERRIRDLSHGMRMKFALVCGMAFRPRLLILDEPLSGVDPLTRDEFTASLAEQAGETTILISSHEIQEIEGLITHAGLMQNGRMLFEQPMSEIADRFRRISVTLESAATRPGAIPGHWLDVSTMGNVLTFVDTQFSGAKLGDHVRSILPGVRNIDAELMPLRSIFTSIERHAALVGGES